MSANQATILVFALALGLGCGPAAAQAPGDAPSPQAVAGLNNLTIGMLATLQSQTLAAEAAKRVGMLGSTAQPPAAAPSSPSSAPAVEIAPKPVKPAREARLVAVVAKQGQLLFTEWDENGAVFQRNVGESVLGWVLHEADPAGLQVRRGSEKRSLSVGEKVRGKN